MKRKRARKHYTIALLYHFVQLDKKDDYFSEEHKIVDNQTTEMVEYMKALFRRRGYRVQVITVYPDDLSELRNLKADYVFNLVDSKAMEIQIAKILSRFRIPHSGSPLASLRISNNKILAKRIFQKHQLPTPQFTIIRPGDRISKSLIPSKFPVIVKPAFEHCSIGINEKSIATSYKQFKTIVSRQKRKYRQTLIAEQFIQGREFHLTVLEQKTETLSLPLAEMMFRGKVKNKWNIFGFEEKWNQGEAVHENCTFISPIRKLDKTIIERIQRDGIRAFYALGFRDYARFDVRYNPKTKQWFFLEGNANAGFSTDPDDAMSMSIKAYGMTLDDFILQIVRNTLH